MGRLIDELTEILKKHADEANEKCCIAIKNYDKYNQMFESGRCAGYSMSIKIIKDIINEHPKVSEWIPCSEKLPEQKGYYLTTTMYSEVYYDYWDGDNFDRTESVIAWQPLPEAYKE